MEQEKLNKLATFYYSRKDIREAIFNFCRNRETVPRYYEGFGKRPDSIEYPSDILMQVQKGATSFHCSEELWSNPLEISTELSKDKLNELRQGWDLLIDIDSKYLDYSKIATELIIKALRFHNVKSMGIKFSGSKGFHVIVPWQAFPSEINSIKTSEMFPEWPRIIVSYLNEFIKNRLIEKITSLTSDKASYIKDFEAPKQVISDLVLVSPRHLFRTPYSLHEKTGMASIVLDETELLHFQPEDANPLKMRIKNYSHQAEKNEASQLLIQALDWSKESRTRKEAEEKQANRKFEEIKVDKSGIIYPPSIKKMLEGLKDGKKRALFIMLNFFRSLNFTKEEVEKKIADWNIKNEKPLSPAYIKLQLEWTFKQKKRLPPNFDKPFYSEIGIIPNDEELKYKNPVNYVVKKSKWLKDRT